MNTIAVIRPTVVTCVCALIALAAANKAEARSPEQDYYKAYYLEQEHDDFAAAAKLYRAVAEDRHAEQRLREQARQRLAGCNEEIASADLSHLMPPSTLVYLELDRPGDRVSDLLATVGLLAGVDRGQAQATTKQHVAVSPKLVHELLGLRGAAIAVTGFDPEKQMPTGVAVLHPGNIDLIRGIVETALPAAAPAEILDGYPTYFIEEGRIYVCLGSRLVIASTTKDEIRGVLARISGKETDSFEIDAAVKDSLAQHSNSLLFACADIRRIMPLLMQMPGAADDMAPARALLDLDNLRWLVTRIAVDDQGLYFDLAATMEEGHHNVAYNLIRTPPITRSTLNGIPAGVAAFVSAAMNHAESDYSAGSTSSPRAVTGLDIGREVFANVVDFSVFALPPDEEQASAGPMPHVAAVVRVHDASRSMALWNQILGIASLATGAPTMDGSVHKIAGLEAQAYRFDAGVTVHVATLDDKLLLSTTSRALKQAAATARGGSSILDDEAFASNLRRIGTDTSKAVFLNPGRCLRIARAFMSPGERKQIEPFVGLLGQTVVSVLTNEANDQLHLSGAVTGLPDLGPLLAELLQSEQHGHRMHARLQDAKQAQDWDEALAIVNGMLEQSDAFDLHRTKFEILALGQENPRAAREWAQVVAGKMGGNSTALNNFAWELLTSGKYDEQYNELALTLAEQACEKTEYKNWALLDTLALAKFNARDVLVAYDLQKKAVEIQGGTNEALIEALQKYKAAKDE